MSTSKSAKKNTSPSLIVVLALPPRQLAHFPSSKTTAAQSTDATQAEASPPLQPADPTDKSSDSNSTPAPPADAETADGASLAPPKVDGRRKRGGAAAAVTGRKRAPPIIDPSAPPRERGRPGPKKKPRLPDGTIDRSGDGRRGPIPTTGTTLPAHKLGPKANTGAINAGLRALDRSGKPCRKWERKGLQLKSFTGTVWGLSSWKAPQRDDGFAGDVKSDSTGSSEVKPNESSVVGSARSNSGVPDQNDLMNGIESSPAPAVLA